MSWYKTGTITVNNGSAAVTGSGTAWIANAAAGEAIYLPDGKFYEIGNVNSDTSLTLASNYTGTSLAGQSYTILPSQSFIRDLAAQAAALINSYASIANNAGAGKFGDGTLGAPGISFVNDINTGIRRTADGTFTLVANGVDVATIGPGGMVLVTPNIGAATGTSLALSGALTAVAGAFSGLLKNERAAGGDTYINHVTTGINNTVLGFNNSGSTNASGVVNNDAYVGSLNAYSTSVTGNGALIARFVSTAQGPQGLMVNGVLGTSGDVTVGAAASTIKLALGNQSGSYYGYVYQDAGTTGKLRYNSYAASGSYHGHQWEINGTAAMVLSSSGNLTADSAANYHQLSSSSANSYGLIVRSTNATPASQYIIDSRFVNSAPNDTNARFFTGTDTTGTKIAIYSNGNIQNVNNSYGAISDPDLKDNIVRAGSQWDDVKELARNVCKFSLKADPKKIMQIGFVSRDVGDIKGVRSISPGLVYTADNYEDVVVEPARTEVKIVQRQATQKGTVEQPTPTLVDGRYMLRMVPTEIDAPLIEEHPLYAEDGSPIMEIVEPEQLAVTDEAGNVVTPAKPAITRQAVHRVPVMEDVEETVEIPAKIERRLTGTKTDGVNYSIAEMKAFKALGEAMERIEALEAEVAAIKGV